MSTIVICIFSIYNMDMSGIPDMYTLGPRAVHPEARGPQARGLRCTYQVDHECPCYKYYVTILPTFSLWFSVS